MTDRLLALRAFVRTAHSGSFSRAGARTRPLAALGLAHSRRSWRREVGARAACAGPPDAVTLDRRRRRLSRADRTAACRPSTRPITPRAGPANCAASLRIALSSSFGVREVDPAAARRSWSATPRCASTSASATQRQDLVADGVDVALRLGLAAQFQRSLRGSSPKAPRLLVGFARLSRASRSAARPRRPRRPCRDRRARRGGTGRLDFHQGAAAASPSGWRAELTDGGERRRHRRGRRPGLGITATSLWACRAELERGALVRAMSDWDDGRRSKSTLSSPPAAPPRPPAAPSSTISRRCCAAAANKERNKTFRMSELC